jgi:ADYC domain
MRDGQLVARGYADTEALRGVALVGTAPDGRTFSVEVAAVTLDERTRRIELKVDGLPACDPDLHGVFVPGRWDDRGGHVDDANLLTYACMSGVIAKCVKWGYAPWLTDGQVHAACTRLARADYCGDGVPWTMDGTLVNVFDRLGVQTPLIGGTMTFEAAWGPSGAICVARTRYQIHDSAGRTLQPSCLASLPTCNSLDAPAAAGAMLANKSNVAPISACE